ncbi:desmoglein-2.1 [Cyprinus carpio]|uniref:Desmoglein-2.1 n=1 Tax=Cyprinus carpio TaxID=7962 RepID=A0A9Q9XK95_CYPCA|nr:desmoglein-2.1 [Cyprinus carpio]
MARRISPAVVFLFYFGLSHVFEVEARFQNSVALHRQKREWIIPPQILEENVDYTKREFIAKIRSDKEDIKLKNVRYSLKGVGADKEPFNLFVVNPENGYVRITGILDRESIAQYNLSGVATFTDGTIAENDIGLRIRVKDQNDNPPVFGLMDPGAVDELSPAETEVMKINCFDADEPGNPNSQIKYEIVEQQPAGERMFRVDSDGKVRVVNPNLDRETIDQYVLLVKASDLNGAPGGNVATGTVIIKINDVNDNVPTLEGPFEASIEENTEKVEVMRLKASDLDLQDTDNWVTKCFIASGNEAGYFSIHTDTKTNEAVLMLDKAVDYEDVKDLKLGIGVVNVAPFHSSVSGGGQVSNINFGGTSGGTGGGGASSGGSWSTAGGQIYNVNVKVKNQPEGPKFMPQTKAIPISEGKTFNSNEVIARYPATDTDTGKEATNVKYVKGFDPDNWLTIDETTGAIKMNKAPDRESKYLVNGTYYAHIYSITQDLPSKTATGTIAIQVEDFNDHCPTLTSKVNTLCTDKDAILVTALDEDAPPNGAPFTFNVVPEGTMGKWTVEHLNDTTAIFRTNEKLWPGEYELTVDVKDQQGLSCPEPQKIQVDVCTCTNQGACARAGPSGISGAFKGSRLGPAGIGLLFLGLLSLLLIPLLLLLCQCGAAGMAGAFRDMPFDTKEHLISYHTEGQGEDRDVPLDFIDNGRLDYASKDVGGMSFFGGGGAAGGAGGTGFMESTSTMGFRGYNEMEMSYMDSIRRSETLRSRGVAGDFDGMAVSDMFLGEYYSQKSRGMEDGFAKNGPKVYDFEGQGSPVGSVGCCSILEDNNDLEFLNDLGPKFTTLAEICGGKKIEVPAPLPPPPKPIVGRTEVVSSSTNVINPGNITTNRAITSNTLNIASNTATTSSTRVENVMVTDNRPTVITSVQPAPTLLVQPQPMYYMVEPQPTTVMFTERPAMGQNMYVLNSGPVAEGVVVQGANIATNTLTRGERMVLVDRGAPAQAGVLQRGNLSGSQVLLVDGGATSGQALQGTLQRGVAGSQGLMVVEGQGGHVIQGSLRKGVSTHGGSQNVFYMESKGGSGVGVQKGMMSTAGSFGSIGLGGSSVPINQNPSSQKVVVQERKVVTTQSVKQ